MSSAALAVVLGALSSCDAPGGAGGGAHGGDPPPHPVWFEDATEAVGLDFVHDAGTPGAYFMPEVIGSGAALLDFNNDGRLDVYLLQNGEPRSGSHNRLFRQEPDGRFTDVSQGSGLDVAGRGMGVAAGDVNNDGLADVLVTEYGRARLFLNGGAGRFVDSSAAAGIDNPAWGASASCLDFDRDGWLDLVIVNYVLYSPTRPCSDQAGRRDYCGPQPFPGSVARLFRNLGPRGAIRGAGDKLRGVVFEDVTVTSGLASHSGPGLGVFCADFDGDRWVDVFVANDGKPNFLWMNQRDGTFREEALLRGVAYNGMGQAQADMGIAAGDVNGDGLFDLYITHLTDEQHILLRQSPRGTFTDATAGSGLARPAWNSTGFGAACGDFDHDGDLDLVQANGRVKFIDGPSPPELSFWDVYKERNQLFMNRGDGRFDDVSSQEPALCGRRGIARALAVGDIDNDGDLDILVTYVAERARLYRNVSPKRGNWLVVRALDDALGGRDAYGAEVTVDAGGRRRWGLVNPGQSYFASSDTRVHFGLGAAERADAIAVVWPDGSEETFAGAAANQVVTLRKGQGARKGR